MTLIPDLERDLVKAAERMRRPARRAHRRLRVAAPGLAAAVVVAAVVALSQSEDSSRTPSGRGAADGAAKFTTGVPAVDKLLQVESVVEGGRNAGRDIRPGPGPASEPLEVPVIDRKGHAVAYLSREDLVCHATAQPHPRIPGSVRGTTGGCQAPLELARVLDRRLVRWEGSSLGPDRRVFDGYAAARVEEITVVGDDRAMRVELSPPWTPNLPGARPIRHFVVVDETDIDVGGDGLQPGEIDLTPTLPPRVEVRLAGGEVREIAPP